MVARALTFPSSLGPHYIEEAHSTHIEVDVSQTVSTPSLFVENSSQVLFADQQKKIPHFAAAPYPNLETTGALDTSHTYTLSSQIQGVHPPSSQPYCLMTVPSGLMHAPFLVQCVPVVSTLPSSPRLEQSHFLEQSRKSTNPLAGPGRRPISYAPPSSLNPGMTSDFELHPHTRLNTVASALTQMKTSSFSRPPTFGPQKSVLSAAVSRNMEAYVEAGDVGPHEKPRPHICKMKDNWGHLCKRTFTRPYDLQRHQETVHGSATKSYSCEECGCKSKNFSRQDSLARHIRRMHRPVNAAEHPVVVPKVEEECSEANLRVCEAPKTIRMTFTSSQPRIDSTDCKPASDETDERNADSEPERKRIKIEHLLAA